MICPGMTSSQTCEQGTARGRNCESLLCTPPCETKRCWRVSHGQPGSGEWKDLREERTPGKCPGTKCPRRENHHLDLCHTESDKDPEEERGPRVFSSERIQARFRWNYWQQKQSFNRIHLHTFIGTRAGSWFPMLSKATGFPNFNMRVNNLKFY